MKRDCLFFLNNHFCHSERSEESKFGCKIFASLKMTN